MIESLKSLAKTHSERKRSLFLRDVCRSLDIHVSEARRLLEELVATECHKEFNFEATYNLTGFDGSSSSDEVDGYRQHKFKSVSASELEEKKKDFDELVGCHISGLVLQDDPVKFSSSLIGSDEQMKKEQKHTCIINDELEVRHDLREYYQSIYDSECKQEKAQMDAKVKVEEDKDVELIDESEVEKKSEIREKSKNSRSKPSSKNNKKNSKSLAKKPKKKIEEEESPPDPFSEEEKEEEEEEEEEEIKPSPEIEEESEDDEPIVKKKSKSRRRVVAFDEDSDNEEGDKGKVREKKKEKEKEKMKEKEKEKKPLPDWVSTKKEDSNKEVENEVVQEEYMDEDGYICVSKSKKSKAVETKPKSPPPPECKSQQPEDLEGSPKEPVRETTGTRVNPKKKRDEEGSDDAANEDRNSKKKKVDEGATDSKTKSKSKKPIQSKNQASITSFFKPAVKT